MPHSDKRVYSLLFSLLYQFSTSNCQAKEGIQNHDQFTLANFKNLPPYSAGGVGQILVTFTNKLNRSSAQE